MNFNLVYKDLKPSTITVEVYTNINVNLDIFFNRILIDDSEIKYTEIPNKGIIKKSIKCRNGYIYSCHLCNKCKGLDMRKKKKKYFRNQVMIYIKVDDININIMMFKKNFKITGCKSMKNIINVCQYLFEDYLYEIKKNIDSDVYDIKKEDNKILFLIDPVMINYKFNLDFPIHRISMNSILNDKKYSKYIDLSHLELTMLPSISIKMFSELPLNHKWYMLIYKNNEFKYRYVTVDKIHLYKNPSTMKKSLRTTIIIFSTSQIIVSGRYVSRISESILFLIDLVYSYKDIIREKVEIPTNKFIFKELTIK